ncbi:MAG: hypothetical protein AAFY20_08955 [Cyanobacteria bacterium J06639_14]
MAGRHAEPLVGCTAADKRRSPKLQQLIKYSEPNSGQPNPATPSKIQAIALGNCRHDL